MGEWIKCTTKLPKEGEKVLSYSKFDGEIRIDYLVYAPEPIWACRLEREETKVIAWIPLPAKPEEE